MERSLIDFASPSPSVTVTESYVSAPPLIPFQLSTSAISGFEIANNPFDLLADQISNCPIYLDFVSDVGSQNKKGVNVLQEKRNMTPAPAPEGPRTNLEPDCMQKSFNLLQDFDLLNLNKNKSLIEWDSTNSIHEESIDCRTIETEHITKTDPGTPDSFASVSSLESPSSVILRATSNEELKKLVEERVQKCISKAKRCSLSCVPVHEKPTELTMQSNEASSSTLSGLYSVKSTSSLKKDVLPWDLLSRENKEGKDGVTKCDFNIEKDINVLMDVQNSDGCMLSEIELPLIPDCELPDLDEDEMKAVEKAVAKQIRRSLIEKELCSPYPSIKSASRRQSSNLVGELSIKSSSTKLSIAPLPVPLSNETIRNLALVSSRCSPKEETRDYSESKLKSDKSESNHTLLLLRKTKQQLQRGPMRAVLPLQNMTRGNQEKDARTVEKSKVSPVNKILPASSTKPVTTTPLLKKFTSSKEITPRRGSTPRSSVPSHIVRVKSAGSSNSSESSKKALLSRGSFHSVNTSGVVLNRRRSKSFDPIPQAEASQNKKCNSPEKPYGTPSRRSHSNSRVLSNLNSSQLYSTPTHKISQLRLSRIPSRKSSVEKENHLQ